MRIADAPRSRRRATRRRDRTGRRRDPARRRRSSSRSTKMNRILDVDVDNGVAWVEPGVVNLDLTKHLRPLGFHFAPDPSSQQVCTIGGNVATNSGGPHCLAYGVTSHHVVAMEVVLPSGEVVELGGLDPEPAGLDLRGAFVGGEGTLGIATADRGALDAEPAGGPHAAARVRLGPSCGRHGRRGHRGRHRARGDGGHGPADHDRGRGVRPRRLSDRRGGRPAGRGGRPRGRHGDRGRPHRRDRPRPRGHEHQGGGDRGRAGVAVEGPQDRVRRGRPDRTVVLPARHGRPPVGAGRRARSGL